MITDQDLNNARFRELYMKYLGVLRVLGEAHPFLQRSDYGREVAESAEMAFDDAQVYLKGRIRIRRTLSRYDLEPVDTDDTEEVEA